MRGGLIAVSALVSTLVLSGCAKDPFTITRSNCPALAVAGKTGTITRFAGAEQRAEDVAVKATITQLRMNCKEGKKDVKSEIAFLIRAERGPAATAQTVTLPWFVVTLKDNRQIITKKKFETTLTFPAGSTKAASREVVSHYLPDIEAARRYDHEVLVGFQLDEGEILFNALRSGD